MSPRPRSSMVAGSGTAGQSPFVQPGGLGQSPLVQTGVTISILPLLISLGISIVDEFSMIRFDSVIGLIPRARALKPMTTRLPVPVAPETGPLMVSAVLMMLPEVLSILPAMKIVVPADGRNVPSVMFSADSTAGLKAISN